MTSLAAADLGAVAIAPAIVTAAFWLVFFQGEA
jgi:hypothetical protein